MVGISSMVGAMCTCSLRVWIVNKCDWEYDDDDDKDDDKDDDDEEEEEEEEEIDWEFENNNDSKDERNGRKGDAPEAGSRSVSVGKNVKWSSSLW